MTKAIFRDLVKKADEPDGNHCIYPRAVLKKAVDEWNEKNEHKLGHVTVGNDPAFTPGLATTACKIDLKMGEEGIEGEILEVLPNPNGAAVQMLLESGEAALAMRGTGTVVDKDGVHEIQPGFSIDAVSVMPKKHKA